MRRTPLKRKTPLKASVRPKARRKGRKPTHVLWELCKALTRAKYGNSCYTCPAKDLAGSNWHTGHFITKSICSNELAYDLLNLRPQCYHCNINLSGNWPAFESRLVREHGREYAEELKRRNFETKGKKYGTPWVLAKIAEYEALLAKSQK